MPSSITYFKMKTICFISHSPPDQLGGVSLYYKNLLNSLKDKDLKITWAYSSNKNNTYHKDDINYIELKQGTIFKYFQNNFKVRKFLKQNYFDIVFTTGGPWTYFYSKPKYQKIIHIFHGTVYHFCKNAFKRLSLLKQILLYPVLSFSKLVERPHKEADKTICVSDKVKKQVKDLYHVSNIKVIRIGVNINEFKPRENPVKDKIGLYGLYIGGGGDHTKGLDRVINLSREMYKLNPDYRLIVIGPDKTKIGNLLDEEFVIFKENVPRNQIKYYYNLGDVFFCMSRYEGGAPTLVVSEAMASGCLVVCAKSAKQEIIKNGVNGLVISKFNYNNAKKILNNLKDERLITNSLNTIKKLSLKNWGNEYFKLIKSYY